ncbi:MAG: GvpL/GvpF family gas vesicle protein [Actinobacteria bacterium]|nr:GvpL/GvpF family gas vesicle protein [Actinomycetota bacterium]
MTDKAEPRYVYGVVRADTAAPAVDGIAAAPLELIADGDVAALTSIAPDQYLEVGREELLTHSRVLEAALDKGTVLPMRFGVVLSDEETLRSDLLDAHHDELAVQLTEMDGKVEMTLKGVYDEEAVLREIVAEHPGIAQLRGELEGKPEAATYYERIRLGELVAAAFVERQELDSEAAVEDLRLHAVAVAVGEPIHERMAVNASFLVERAKLDEFDRALDAIGERKAKLIRFRVTGPLPPHSFVELGVAA